MGEVAEEPEEGREDHGERGRELRRAGGYTDGRKLDNGGDVGGDARGLRRRGFRPQPR